jgi:cellulose synthase/poly-beta-1,6-N-acetylglucosamine synthase-like glycosyltransferase
MAHSIVLWVFWSSALFLIYTFAGYPVILLVLSFFHNQAHERAPVQPMVSIIIAAHNEAIGISKKILNCLELTYPSDRYEILVASDGSTDGTADIVRSFASRGVKLIEIPDRRGKQYAQLQARDVARGEILVFTDAGVELNSDALQTIVSNFADPCVGCVSSEDQVVRHPSWKGEQSYVSFEMWIRRMESRIGSLVTASGSFFAARRGVCETWHTDQTSDFFVVLNTVNNGMRAVVDPDSIGRYGLAQSDTGELQRKIRTIVNGLEVFFTHLDLLNPFRYGLFSWQLISHKLFRWLTPCAIVMLFTSNLFLWTTSDFYRVCLMLQTGLYGAGMLALAAKSLAGWKPIKMAGYFLLGNAATLMAWFYFLSGEKFVSWQPTQRS